MGLINNNVDDDILKEFRNTTFKNLNLKRATFKKSLEIAMLDYIIHYSKSPESKEFANHFKNELSP